MGWKSGKTTYVPLWDKMEGAWLWTLLFIFPSVGVVVLTHVGWNKVWILTMVPVAEQVPQLLRDKQVGWNRCLNCSGTSR